MKRNEATLHADLDELYYELFKAQSQKNWGKVDRLQEIIKEQEELGYNNEKRITRTRGKPTL